MLSGTFAKPTATVELSIDGAKKKHTALGVGSGRRRLQGDRRADGDQERPAALPGERDHRRHGRARRGLGHRLRGRPARDRPRRPLRHHRGEREGLPARAQQARLAQAAPRRGRAQGHLMERILLLPGDGIGPEVTREAQRALDAAARRAGLKLGFEEDLIGGASIDAHGTPLSDRALARARESRAVLMGAVGGPKWDALPVDRRAREGAAAAAQGAGPVREPAPGGGAAGAGGRLDAAPRRWSRGPTCWWCASSRAGSTSASRAARRWSRAGARRATRWCTTRSRSRASRAWPSRPRAGAASW